MKIFHQSKQYKFRIVEQNYKTIKYINLRKIIKIMQSFQQLIIKYSFMARQISYCFDQYILHNQTKSLLKFYKQKKSNSPIIAFQSSQFSKQHTVQKSHQKHSIHSNLETFKSKSLKNNNFKQNIDKESIDVEFLISKQIKQRIKKKVLQNGFQTKYNNLHFQKKTESLILENNIINKFTFFPFKCAEKQQRKIYKDQLQINSNGCTLSTYSQKKKHSKTIPARDQKKFQTIKPIIPSQNEQNSVKKPKRRFKLTRPMYLHKKQKKIITNQLQFMYLKQKQNYTEETIRFLNLDEKNQIDLKKNLLQNFMMKQQIFGQAFTIVHSKATQNRILYEHNAYNQMEIASLTKVMTCFLILLLAEKFQINLKIIQTKISQRASKLQGTSAKLLYSDVISVNDLLYGLMLPSGNDAALALAEWGGKAIRLNCRPRIQSTASTSPTYKSKSARFIVDQTSKRSYTSLFVYHMNILASTLNLTNTKFANVHGLMNKNNYSCSFDMMKLCLYAMAKKDFQHIVNMKQYKCVIKNSKFSNERELYWVNTNKLLNIDRFCGVKTGITPSAGPCLASSYKISEYQYIYIVLLKTKSVSHRFQQSKKLLIQIIRQLYLKSHKKLYLTILQTLGTVVDISGENQDENNFEPSQQQQNMNGQFSQMI